MAQVVTPHQTLVRLNEAERLKSLIGQAEAVAHELGFRGLAFRLGEQMKEVDQLGTAQLALATHGR